ncbi:MAG TPA: hypothetical protein VGP08_15740 [Pyrinomonadaceae bacterium]|nr:hypothetical protein [Pyrinomonadaceae bacterium]
MSKSEVRVASPRITDPARKITPAPAYLSRQIPRAASTGETLDVLIEAEVVYR